MDPDDLAQEFFLAALSSEFFGRADPERGSFRAYLVTALRRFVGHRLEERRAAKRAGEEPMESGGESDSIADDCLSPEEEFDREWAAEIFRKALGRLAADATANGRQRHFELLSPFLIEPAERHDYAVAGESLGMRPNAVAVAVLRLRQRFQRLVHDELSQTVSSSTEFDAEMQHLAKALGRTGVAL
jgi:RNA polymerase sigma factor (sigma-70 family)